MMLQKNDVFKKRTINQFQSLLVKKLKFQAQHGLLINHNMILAKSRQICLRCH